MERKFKKKTPLLNRLKIFELVNLCMIVFTGMVIFSYSASFGEQTDPFYSRLLSQGERSFLTRNYTEAVKELEVAAFGLHKDKNLLGKAYVYLGLCYYYLEDDGKSKEFLGKAVSIVREEGFESLGISQSALKDFEKLLAYFKLWTVTKKEESLKAPKETPIERAPIKVTEREQQKEHPTQKPEIREPVKKSPKQVSKDLERRINQEPHNISLYYQLYNYYRIEKNVKAAKELLETLIKNNPNEINAYYLLAKIEFSQKKYQDALQNFNKIINPTDETQVDNELLLKSMMYISSCLYRLDQKQHLKSFVNLIEESTSQDQLIRMLREEGLEKEWGKIKKVKNE